MSTIQNRDFLDLNGTGYQDEMLRELPERYTFLDGMETVVEQSWQMYGAFRPHRFLPSLYVSLQDQEGYVIPHGTIVSGYGLRTGAGVWNSNAGLDTSGDFYVGLGFNGGIKANANDIYGYDRTLDGVIVPTNGRTSSVADLYTTHDVTIKRIKASGAIVTAADANTNTALTRPASMLPIGIVVAQTMRETQGANLSYRLNTAAYSVLRKGVIKIPYVIQGSGRIATIAKGDAGYDSVYWRHQFLVIESAAAVGHEVKVYVDGNGKLALPSNASTYGATFGKIVSWTNDVFDPLRARVDAMPGFAVPGTTTGGLDRRLFDFIKRIREANGQTATPAECVQDVDDGYYGMIKIMFDTTV